MNGRRLIGLALAALLLGGGWTAAQRRAQQQAERWLATAQRATQQTAHYGRQRSKVEVAGHRQESQVDLDQRDDGRTRLAYQSGDAAGTLVVSSGPKQWRWDPQLRRTVEGEALADPLSELPPGRWRVGPGGLVAGRPTVLLRTAGPPRRELWIDRASGVVLRTVTIGPELTTRTEFLSFSLGRRAGVSFEPPQRDRWVLNEVLDLRACSRRCGFTVRPPRWLPGGLRLLGSSCYHCPCGCGMLAAQLRYSDGGRTVSVFQQDRRYIGCVISAVCCEQGSAASSCIAQRHAGLPLVARVDRQPVVVVLGDLPEATLARIADSVP
ncbi:MAG: hypothetical protein IT204_12465 [Fimbriimonadaceae bacterium]|nr:hypothetical protein [Fimbriimonadaceae bacterium]